MLQTLQRRLAAPQSAEQGFTLVEAIVALLVIAVAFTAMAMALISGVRGGVVARENQQAGDLLNQTLEKARALPYSSLAMQTSDLASALDPIGAAVAACGCYNPKADSATGAIETLVTAPGGGVSPHAVIVPENHLSYLVRTYVTKVSDATATDLRRVTVVASWTDHGSTHTRMVSSLVQSGESGLPLPNYTFNPMSQPASCANPGATIAYAFGIYNSGARDSWNITANPSSPAFAYYLDSNGNGSYDPATDTTQLTTVDGVPNTGPIETDAPPFRFFAVATAPATTGTYQVTFTATSAAVPTSSKSINTATTVTTGACIMPTPSPTGTVSPSPTPTPTPTATPPAQPSQPCAAPSTVTPVVNGQGNGSKAGTLYTYFLYNGPTNTGDTTAQPTMPFGKTTPGSTTVWDYSTDLHSSPTAGRQLNGVASSSSASTSTSVESDWQYTVSGASTFNGTGVLTLYALPVGTSGGSLTVFVSQISGSTTTSLSSASTTASWTGCSGYSAFQVPLTFDNVNLKKGDRLDIKLEYVGPGSVNLAYDAAPSTGFAANAVLPVVSGG